VGCAGLVRGLGPGWEHGRAADRTSRSAAVCTSGAPHNHGASERPVGGPARASTTSLTGGSRSCPGRSPLTPTGRAGHREHDLPRGSDGRGPEPGTWTFTAALSGARGESLQGQASGPKQAHRDGRACSRGGPASAALRALSARPAPKATTRAPGSAQRISGLRGCGGLAIFLWSPASASTADKGRGRFNELITGDLRRVQGRGFVSERRRGRPWFGLRKGWLRGSKSWPAAKLSRLAGGGGWHGIRTMRRIYPGAGATRIHRSRLGSLCPLGVPGPAIVGKRASRGTRRSDATSVAAGRAEATCSTEGRRSAAGDAQTEGRACRAHWDYLAVPGGCWTRLRPGRRAIRPGRPAWERTWPLAASCAVERLVGPASKEVGRVVSGSKVGDSRPRRTGRTAGRRGVKRPRRGQPVVEWVRSRGRSTELGQDTPEPRRAGTPRRRCCRAHDSRNAASAVSAQDGIPGADWRPIVDPLGSWSGGRRRFPATDDGCKRCARAEGPAPGGVRGKGAAVVEPVQGRRGSAELPRLAGQSARRLDRRPGGAWLDLEAHGSSPLESGGLERVVDRRMKNGDRAGDSGGNRYRQAECTSSMPSRCGPGTGKLIEIAARSVGRRRHGGIHLPLRFLGREPRVATDRLSTRSRIRGRDRPRRRPESDPPPYERCARGQLVEVERTRPSSAEERVCGRHLFMGAGARAASGELAHLPFHWRVFIFRETSGGTWLRPRFPTACARGAPRHDQQAEDASTRRRRAPGPGRVAVVAVTASAIISLV